MERTPRRTVHSPQAETSEQAWYRAFPGEVRNGIVRPRALRQLLEAADSFLRTGSLPALVELEEQVYGLASRLEARIGHEATLRYLRDGLVRALTGNGDGRTPPSEALSRVIARASDAIWSAYSDQLQETIRRQQDERLRHELTLAKRIQERLLPRTVPSIPGFDIAGRVLPALEVGGDYWSCKYYPEDHVVTIKLADVTGHGIAAATLVAAVKFITGGYYRGAAAPEQVMERTNHVLVKETPHEILVTMVYAWLYPDSREMLIVNAGHSPVLHYHRGEVREIPPTGFALGLMETRYGHTRLRMDPGDVFLTCSDGVTAPGPERSLGEEWVREKLVAHAELSADDLADRILQEAQEAYGTLSDDMSIVAVKALAP